jgi:arsenate reductase
MLAADGVTVYINRQLLADVKDPGSISFAFGPLGRCRALLPPVTVLFACVHSAGRSQIAAAFFNALAHPARARALSAGTQPAAAGQPEVMAMMAEVGINLAAAVPQRLTDELAETVDVLITMGCGEECPYVPGVETDDWAVLDPKDRPLDEVRAVRDDIRARVEALIATRGWRR